MSANKRLRENRLTDLLGGALLAALQVNVQWSDGFLG